jgi:hypothetical protein
MSLFPPVQGWIDFSKHAGEWIHGDEWTGSNSLEGGVSWDQYPTPS